MKPRTLARFQTLSSAFAGNGRAARMAPTAAATDWAQILALYELLRRASDNPVVALYHAVAAAMVHGPRAGLELLAGLAADARLATGHRFHAMRASCWKWPGTRRRPTPPTGTQPGTQ